MPCTATRFSSCFCSYHPLRFAVEVIIGSFNPSRSLRPRTASGLNSSRQEISRVHQTTVTSIPVEWSVQLMAPPPPQYTLTNQPFVFDCTGSAGPVPLVAYAPSDAKGPLNGSWSSANMIQDSMEITCP